MLPTEHRDLTVELLQVSVHLAFVVAAQGELEVGREAASSRMRAAQRRWTCTILRTIGGRGVGGRLPRGPSVWRNATAEPTSCEVPPHPSPRLRRPARPPPASIMELWWVTKVVDHHHSGTTTP